MRAGVRASYPALAWSSAAMSASDSESSAAREACGLRDGGGAGDRRRHARLCDDPGERDFRRLGVVAGSDRVERVENAKAARVQIALHAAARALAQVLLAAVLARQKALRQAEIGDDADLLAPADFCEAALEPAPVDEIVFRLQHFIARQ